MTMAGVAAADRTVPNLEVLPDSTRDGYLISAPPFTILPGGFFGGDKFNSGDGTIGVGIDPIRIEFSVPEHPRYDDMNLKVFAWMDNPNVLITPGYVRLYSDGFNTNHTGSASLNPAGHGLQQNTRYVLEYWASDADTLSINLWHGSGGPPLAQDTLTCGTGVFTDPVPLYIGWPPSDHLVGLITTDPLVTQVNDYTAYAHYPYMMKIHYAGEGNLGPTSAEFTQETALSQAADLPAGTYVGYFTVTHPRGITTHVYSDMGAPFDNEFEIKNNKLYTKVRSSALTVINAGIDVLARDVFNKEIATTASGDLLVVTA